ncbi:hypothetical protein DPMN_133471 [Dreissena polymorpha]|uniref:Uncharacterized protein n=1 Tax=Dreissena polymorpha TaxID=45954 RepID=A0A9D4JB11_DREPO|nr:hypothetical protein DPMN_133471 [Dreissena polymorpha]
MLAGSHYIHLFWSDLPLVNSPFHGYAIQQVPDASKLILTGRGLKEATVREEAEFVIDGSQAGKGRANYCDENGTIFKIETSRKN